MAVFDMKSDGGPPLIDVKYLGEYDAMVIMRSKGKELAFVMRNDMPSDGFSQCCQRLRELTLGPEA